MAEKKVITRKDWQSSFTLIGRPVIGDFTYKLDERSEKSNWVYNALNLGVDCGENAGVIYAEMLGGYSENGENKLFAHGKDESGNDDFGSQIVVDWEDRFNESVLEEIGRMSFIRIGLEKTSEGKTYYKDFLSAYDAIAYIQEHLSEDMVINVRGSLKYSVYNDNVQVRKNITSIVLSKVEDPTSFKATFTQSILIDKDSASLKNIDKAKGVMFVDAKVLDYVKEVNGVEVKGQYPFNKTFEFEMNFENEKQCKMIVDKLFKVKKGYTQITFEGKLVESGAMVTATLDDLSDEVKELIEMGLYSEEEALASCTGNGSKERRMVLTKPSIRLVGEDKTPVIQKFPERYTEEDLILDYIYENKADDEEVPFDTDETSVDDEGGLDWLSSL
jgi:hypothetical protein